MKDIDKILSAISSLTTAVADVSTSVNDMKNRVEQLEAKATSKEEADEILKQRAKSYKVQAYKVLSYTNVYTDVNGETKKDYALPGMTFKDKESALEYVRKNPGRSLDIMPA